MRVITNMTKIATFHSALAIAPGDGDSPGDSVSPGDAIITPSVLGPKFWACAPRRGAPLGTALPRGLNVLLQPREQLRRAAHSDGDAKRRAH